MYLSKNPTTSSLGPHAHTTVRGELGVNQVGKRSASPVQSVCCQTTLSREENIPTISNSSKLVPEFPSVAMESPIVGLSPRGLRKTMIGSSNRPLVPLTPPTPSGLPPKSPASIAGRKLLTTASRAVKPRRRRRSRSRERKKNRESDEVGSTSEETPRRRALSLAPELQVDQSLTDPGPDHMNVASDVDDFCNAADFSCVSFESNPSPTSVADPLANMDASRKRVHSRSKSWDFADNSYQESASKTCLQVPSIFRRQKVMCADVASVGNASDTVVTVEDTGRISGRELHEKAKEVLNDGNFQQAVAMFEALKRAQTERFGQLHSSVGAATHNVAVVRLRMGEAKKAEELLIQTVAIRRKVLGNDHLELAASLAKLGSARVLLQKFDDGLLVLREALRITRKTLGRSHKAVAQILCHIACLYFEAGEMFSAQATFEDALEILREVLPTEVDGDACTAQTAEVLCNIGSIQNKRKNHQAARDCFGEALELQRGIMSPDHPRVIDSLDNLGYSFSKNKSYNQALTCYKEMLTAQLNRYGCHTSACCRTLKKQVLILEKLKNLDGAIKVTKKALNKVRRESPVPDDSVVCELENVLQDLRMKRERRKGEF